MQQGRIDITEGLARFGAFILIKLSFTITGILQSPKI